ncbi:MAG: winged helix-turn-helix domain-containing protein [Thermoproteota archaeon]
MLEGASGEIPRKHRSEEAIIAQILTLLQERGACRQTHLMNGASLSWGNLIKYVNWGLSAGLMVKNGEMFTITERGTRFIKLYREIKALLLSVPQVVKA